MHKVDKIFSQFVNKLEEANLKYAVCGNYNELPNYTKNDIDIFVEDHSKCQSILIDVARKSGYRLYLQNNTANGSNNYFYREIINNIEIVKIDLMLETAWKSIIPIFKGPLIWENTSTYKNFIVINNAAETVVHLLYPLVSYGIIKDKYKEKFSKIDCDSSITGILNQVVGGQNSSEIIEYCHNKKWDELKMLKRKLRISLLSKMLLSIDYNRFCILLGMVTSIISRSVKRNGVMLCFTGIDGAGKTSIKNIIASRANTYFTKNKFKEYYWRPFLFPRISELFRSNGQREVLDTQGARVVDTTTTVSIKSYLKYIYYIIDYSLGKVKYFANIHTGGITIFDRYHLDNIVYPERFGFRINKSFMRLIDRFLVPRPDLIIFFDADTNTLYKRKEEISPAKIEEQKNLYREELRRRNKVKIINTDASIETSVNFVLLEVLRYMSSRY